MNDPILLTKRLEDLAGSALQAGSIFEKAAIYAAARSIRNQFDSNEEDFGGYALEKAYKACHHICAAVGYDIDNGHSSSDHISWAYGEISSLQSVLERRPR